MTAEEIEGALQRVGQVLESDIDVEILIVGGAAGMLTGVFPPTRTTTDCDVMLYVPAHCAHGYQTLEEDTEIYYLASGFYAPGSVRGLRFDDPAFNIQWPLVATVVSEQDLNWPLVERQG